MTMSFKYQLVSLALLSSACGGGSTVAAGAQHEPRVIDLDEIPTSACPQLDTDSPVEVVAVDNAARPEAVGYWVRVCDPDHPGPHQPRAYDAIVYDGAYVTLLAHDRTSYEAVAPLATYNRQRPFRLESAWVENVLRVRVPAWLSHDPEHTGSAFMDIARFAEGEFVWPDNGHPAYQRSELGLSIGTSRDLIGPHAPIDDYEGERDARHHQVFSYLGRLVRPCAMDALSSGLAPSGRIIIGVDEQGMITNAVFQSSMVAAARLRRCFEDALDEGAAIEGYAAPNAAHYLFDFDARQSSGPPFPARPALNPRGG